MSYHRNVNTISVKNLQLPHGIVAQDIWGKAKVQPATVSITLGLREIGFSSAANKDALDESTVHYGNLSKRIRSASRDGQTVQDVHDAANAVVRDMASKKDGKFIASFATVGIKLPKASLWGEAVTVSATTIYSEDGKVERMDQVYAIEDMKLRVLVGVNEYERQGKQPIVALCYIRDPAEKADEKLFGLEGKVVEIIEQTSFETLEALVDHTVRELHASDMLSAGSQVGLKLEKPRAIPFADAPVVEVVRARGVAGSAQTSERVELNVIKPYLR